MDKVKKEFPEGMVPLGKSVFHFRCGPDVECYMQCCRKLDLILYPYDIIRLKNRLGISSEEFMRNHTRLGPSGHPFFPSVMLLMADNDERICPFLDENGCSVYEDRPTACRTYPLERAVDRSSGRGSQDDYYFMTNHSYCLGHQETKEWTVKTWLKDQKIQHYNAINDLWAEIDTLFSQNPWQGEGVGGPRQQMAFMVCYNIDGFRAFVRENKLTEQFKLESSQRRIIAEDDEALLKFGFEWLKYVLADQGRLIRK
ncbi:MAG: YkgJ family cysteine cluster protein [Deltaproteobacteria bacterium]|jgi:Fe-S-cluster containining protein|nr:YkgJ family cysteine cluster protein [Deltaproteobacteria bacterium]